MRPRVKKRLKIFLIIMAVLLILVFGGFYIYTLDYYRADDIVMQTFETDNGRIQKLDNMTVFYPDEQKDASVGLIFYPGGKVEDIAYAPLLERLSKNGITCVLIKMPFNLAVFNINAADDVYDEFPEIENWYLAGHSLGGAMASSYCGKNSSNLNGLILLGAYPINDAQIPTLAIYGSEDIKLDLEKLADTQNKLEIAGGNHAYFGNYGEQEGDGTASISREEQQQIAEEAIMDFIFN